MLLGIIFYHHVPIMIFLVTIDTGAKQTWLIIMVLATNNVSIMAVFVTIGTVSRLDTAGK